jgi:carbon-monoxide dehydrogenase small subunit
MNVTIVVNGEARSAVVAGWESLLRVLRDDLGLAGSKNACEQGECGSCTVLLDGALVCSCLVMGADCDGSEVTTVEGLGGEGRLDPVQEAMLAAGGVQCGFCTPGFVVAGADLFAHDPAPDTAAIREALSGNVCRCTGYGAILRALQRLAVEGAP